MHAIDMHCDTLMNQYMTVRKKLGFTDPLNIDGANILDGDTMVNLERLRQAEAMAQFFAIFMFPYRNYKKYCKVDPLPDEVYIAGCAKIFETALVKNAHIAAKACTAADIEKNFAAGKISAVLTMEDGRAVAGNIENLDRYYNMGIRAISLTWNDFNCIGAPCSDDPAVMRQGLTSFGKEAVTHMQELGIMVDVSHLSDGGFYDVAKICKKPFIATHSNCRALSPHRRNLTDEMIRVIGDAGGVAGLNFGPEFLNKDITCKESTAAMIAKHARHMANVGGVGCVALGSDFDGIHGELEIGNSSQVPLLAKALQMEGFSEDEIDQIAEKNVLRVMRDTIC